LSTESTVSDLRLFKILSLEEELVITVLKAGLELTSLSCHVKVASSSELVLFAKLVVVS
jgi:hypothetical protein